MKIFVLNKDFEIIGMLEEYSSVEWVRRYNEAGDFVLSTIATTGDGIDEELGTLELLSAGNYVAREDDDMIAQIEKRNIVTSSEKSDIITVSGRSVEKLLGQRIIWKQTNTKSNETVEAFLRRLVDENAISPEDSKRKIPNLTIGFLKNLTEKIEKQITGDNLLTAIEEICKAYEYGFKITMNDDGMLVFDVYKGKDRSYNQAENPFVIFSDDFENITNTEYEYDKSNFSNVALVGGEGEGTERKYQTVGESSGIERYEMFVDAKDVSTNDGEITESAYNLMLIEKGMEKIAEHAVTETFEGELETENQYKYKEDYEVGDVVQVENKHNMQATTRILEIIESDNENGYRVVPTFGTWEV